MSKIGVIIGREYWSRVKKKSFIIMTFLTPILLASLMVLTAVLSIQSKEKPMNIMVVDDNDLFINQFEDTKLTQFSYRSGNVDDIKAEAFSTNFDGVIHILELNDGVKANFYYQEEPSMTFKSKLESQIDKVLFDKMLVDTFNIDPKKFEFIKGLTKSQIATIKVDEQGNEKKSFTEITIILGMFFGFVIYFLIFLFASQVLRGVLEEKTNRIVEVLISSVKPMELMIGKIVGIALVGLTQFLLWIVFTFTIILGVSVVGYSDEIKTAMSTATETQSMQMVSIDQEIPEISNTLIQDIQNYFPISFTEILLCFLFYFVIGYLTYSALFVAIGSAVDSETDSQQFILPVTIPLILAIATVVPMASDPNGTLAIWMSMIPLTSPIAMMVRLPAGVPFYELMISMGLSILFLVLVMWFAAKIYRTGILMYGKKITYKELFKWLRY